MIVVLTGIFLLKDVLYVVWVNLGGLVLVFTILIKILVEVFLSFVVILSLKWVVCCFLIGFKMEMRLVL